MMPLTRSENMARIKGQDTKPEMLLRKALWKRGLRYRLHYSVEGIRPDIVFMTKKVAIFVDGCQWHGCPEHFVFPRTNRPFWLKKLRENVDRDITQTKKLSDAGWVSLRLWEHEIWSNLPETADRVFALVAHDVRLEREQWRLIEVSVVDAENDLEERRAVLLESPSTEQIVRKKRTTAKWKRPKNI